MTFDPNGIRRIARLDLSMGAQIQGFTFNLGDSPTNNGYGGDGGTTSNSAEIHSNDNRFYVSAMFFIGEFLEISFLERFGLIRKSVAIHFC